METYSILEMDYSTQKTKEDATRYADEHLSALPDILETDPILSHLTQNQKNAFYAFVITCHAAAMHSRAEFSVALHPDTNEASTVIVAKEITLKNSLPAIFSTAISLSNCFVIETDEKDPSNLVIFLNYSLDREMEV